MASQEGTSLDQTVDPGIDERLETHSIGETLARLEQCSKLRAFVQENQLEYLLEGSGLHTLFAPTDDAFGEPPASDPEQFLNAHLLRGGFKTFDLRQAKQVKTETGKTIPIEMRDGQSRVGSVNIVRADIPCTNGVIQVIDGVLEN